MIAAYLHHLEELLSTSVIVSDVEVVRRSIRVRTCGRASVYGLVQTHRTQGNSQVSERG